jgi:hypothetical protein
MRLYNLLVKFAHTDEEPEVLFQLIQFIKIHMSVMFLAVRSGTDSIVFALMNTIHAFKSIRASPQ